MKSDVHPRSVECGSKLRLALDVAVALVLSIVGIANAEAEPLIKPLPPASAYDPTPRNEILLRAFTIDVLSFVLMHETGHMVFHEYNVPVGSRDTEESAADSFAAAIMTNRVDPGAGEQHNGLVSAALFLHALHVLQQSNAPGQYNWSDEHGEPEQRAYKLACLVYGANPDAFAQIGQIFQLQDRRDYCVRDAKKNQKDWNGVVAQNINPNSGKPFDVWTPHVAVIYHPVPVGLPNGQSPTLSRYREIAQTIGILDFAGRNLLQLKKTAKDVTLELIQQSLNRSTRNPPLDPRQVDLAPILRPNLEHPAESSSLEAYNYKVVGDSCLNEKNEAITNAFWNPDERSITLCYAMLNRVETIGKQLLAVPR
jgi:hypothetical protein